MTEYREHAALRWGEAAAASFEKKICFFFLFLIFMAEQLRHTPALHSSNAEKATMVSRHHADREEVSSKTASTESEWSSNSSRGSSSDTLLEQLHLILELISI